MVFSVIVPFLNEEPYIENCIKALLDQDFDKKEYELIFVDNGSGDKSSEIVKKFHEVNLLNEQKKCAYSACNKGLKEARGDIIAFTNADCVVSRDWLKSIYRGMEKGALDVALGQCFFPKESSYLLKLFEDYENAKTEYVFSSCPARYFFAYTRNMAVRRDAFKTAGFFIESPVLGDTAFVQKLVSSNPKARIAYLDQMRLTHMEITNVTSWLDRIKVYGRHSKSKYMASYRPLTYKIKLQIYNYCTRKKHYRIWKKIIFIILLALGDLAYKIGLLNNKFVKDPA